MTLYFKKQKLHSHKAAAILTGCFLICAFHFCSPINTGPLIYEKSPEYLPSNTPGQKNFPRAGALFLLDEGVQNIYTQNQRILSVLHRRTVIKILNERGYTYANVTIPYESGTEITRLRARTILPDGTIINLTPDQIFDANLNNEFVYYSDHRIKRFTLPAVENGCVIEFSWEKRFNDLYLGSQWPFQREEPVLRSQYSLITPRNWPLQYKLHDPGSAIVYTVSPAGERLKHIWQSKNMPAFIPEPSSPPGYRARSHLLFSPLGMDTWQDAADWYLDLAEKRMLPEQTIRQTADNLVRGLDSPIEKLEAVFTFVQKTIRYIAIEIGIGGYQPHAPESVLRNRFGDCKDMVSLLAALASAADIPLYPVLLSTWPNGQADTSLVTPLNFNHIIALSILENGVTVWMDPTEKKAGFGQLPWYDQDRNALIVRRAGKSKMTRTPRSGAAENRSTRHWSVKFNEKGEASGTVTIQFIGALAMEMRRQLHHIHPDNRISWLIGEVFAHFPVTITSAIRVDHENQIDMPLLISADFKSSSILLKNQNLITLFPDALSTFNWHKIFPAEDRRDDVVMKHALSLIDTVDIRYPLSWSLISEKQKDAIQTEFGCFSWEIQSTAAGAALFNRHFVLEATYIPQSRYTAFRDFLFDTALSDQTIIQFSD